MAVICEGGLRAALFP